MDILLGQDIAVGDFFVNIRSHFVSVVAKLDVIIGKGNKYEWTLG